jgi:hypothetical protein
MEKKEMPPQTTTMPPPPSLPPAGQSRKIVNGHRSPTKDFQRHVRSVLQPLWYNGLIVHSGKGDQAEEAAIVKKPQQTFRFVIFNLLIFTKIKLIFEVTLA